MSIKEKFRTTAATVTVRNMCDVHVKKHHTYYNSKSKKGQEKV